MSLKTAVTRVVDQIGNLILSPPYGGFGYYYNHGPRTRRAVAFTFDDGPGKPCTEQLLDTLGELGVKATFFCVGLSVQWHPDVVQRAFTEGHVIGNHSMMHSRKAGLLLRGGEHIDAADDAIAQVIGCRPHLYRPPWGWLTPWEGQRLRQRGYAVIGWDIYPDDWKVPEVPAEHLVAQIKPLVKPGSIILMHDSVSNQIRWEKTETARAVRLLTPWLRSEGYEIVTVPELLGLPAYRSSSRVPNTEGFDVKW
ncbi:MAG: polysaccharide deacetylase family protein [Chloroflexus aggregans]|uniref:Polysaccharide deacetylase family protein n=1 Tax=Chloroflexus aggregans TaxID=152260 RepID=A0A2J6WVL5_9CHLR|nr:MAG: polysaccharide deacetylase family protein [Chloroflexus aggregans]